jgi:hypothetical protein
VICRDGRMYSVKSGEIRGTAVLSGQVADLGSQAVACVSQDKNVWVATMDRVVNCYSNRGKRLKGIVMSDDVAELCVMSLKRAKVNYLLLVALVSGELCIYRDLSMIHSFKVDAPVTALCYGTYGREESTLVAVHGKGALTIKMWRRTADADGVSGPTGPPIEQDIPLAVPKKTKLYVEQTQREREKAPDIHRAFQRDLCKLRLTTARVYVKTLTEGLMVRISCMLMFKILCGCAWVWCVCVWCVCVCVCVCLIPRLTMTVESTIDQYDRYGPYIPLSISLLYYFGLYTRLIIFTYLAFVIMIGFPLYVYL